MAIFDWLNNLSIPIIGVGKDQVSAIHDEYQVYVNGDYVGNKTLISEGEKISDISKSLSERGFINFKQEVEGNQVNIFTDDSQEAHELKENLNVYLNLR